MTALVSGWMTVSCVDQDVEVALLVIFAAGRRAENPRVPYASPDLADPGSVLLE
jgi:hypothetical protein